MEQEKIVQEAEMSYERKYEFQTERGAKVEVKIEAKIKDLHEGQEELEEILHRFAASTHNFYLDLGRKIAGQD